METVVLDLGTTWDGLHVRDLLWFYSQGRWWGIGGHPAPDKHIPYIEPIATLSPRKLAEFEARIDGRPEARANTSPRVSASEAADVSRVALVEKLRAYATWIGVNDGHVLYQAADALEQPDLRRNYGGE